ncbi:hypothetical protein GQ457_15G020650 [Hibiscus cannabinus]
MSTCTQPRVPVLNPEYLYSITRTCTHFTTASLSTCTPFTTASWSTCTQPRVPVFTVPELQKKLKNMSPMAPNHPQRSPTVRNSIGTIKDTSNHQEKVNASLINIHMMRICLCT